MNGSKLVLPGPNLQPKLILDLLSRNESPLRVGCQQYGSVVEASDREPQRWGLQQGLRILIGGSSCREILFRRFDQFGARVIQLWGLTETTPVATVCKLQPHMQLSSEDRRYQLRARQGMPSPFVEVRAVDDSGEVPWGRNYSGRIASRGTIRRRQLLQASG
jgi:fatty-acyl-CoA synthase